MAAIELFSTSLYSDANLQAYYRLEDATDSEDSGTDYDLTNTGTTTFEAAKFNNGAHFDGSTQALNNATVLSVAPYPRTITGWANFDTLGSDMVIFSLGDDAVHYYVLKHRSSDNHLVFRANNDTQAADVDTGQVLSTGTWYHVAVIQHSAISVSIYVNGSITNDAVATFSATVSDFWLGYLGRSSVWWMDGFVDDVAIFDRALTGGEINTLANGSNNNGGFFALMNR